MQTKHVLLALEDGLSGEISCRLLCSSWRGGSCKLQSQRVALPAGEKPCPLPDLCLIIPCRPSWNPSPMHTKALSCQPLDASGREKTTAFGSGRGQTDVAKWDASLPQSSLALWPMHLLTLPQNHRRPKLATFLSSSVVNYVGK